MAGRMLVLVFQLSVLIDSVLQFLIFALYLATDFFFKTSRFLAPNSVFSVYCGKFQFKLIVWHIFSTCCGYMECN